MLYEHSKWTKVVTHTVKVDPGTIQVYVIRTQKKEKKNPVYQMLSYPKIHCNPKHFPTSCLSYPSPQSSHCDFTPMEPKPSKTWVVRHFTPKQEETLSYSVPKHPPLWDYKLCLTWPCNQRHWPPTISMQVMPYVTLYASVLYVHYHSNNELLVIDLLSTCC